MSWKVTMSDTQHSDKRKKILENLKNIAGNSNAEMTEVKQPKEIVISNNEADRMYQRLSGEVYLINKNYTTYRGKIHKRSILVKGLNKENFRSYVYETADGRWFDRAGLPIQQPSALVKEDQVNDNNIDNKQNNTEENVATDGI